MFCNTFGRDGAQVRSFLPLDQTRNTPRNFNMKRLLRNAFSEHSIWVLFRPTFRVKYWERLQSILVNFNRFFPRFQWILVSINRSFPRFQSILVNFNRSQSVLVNFSQFNQTKTQKFFTDRKVGQNNTQLQAFGKGAWRKRIGTGYQAHGPRYVPFLLQNSKRIPPRTSPWNALPFFSKSLHFEFENNSFM